MGGEKDLIVKKENRLIRSEMVMER